MIRVPPTALGHRMLAIALTTSAIGSTGTAQQLRTSSFVFARYASGSASVLYAARGLGALGGFVGMVQNPKTQYRELIVGGYTQLNWSGQSMLVAVGYADASDSQYLQTYITPSYARARLALSGTFEWYEPLGHAGVRQLDVNPASLEVRMSDHLWAGAAYTLSLAEHGPARRRMGPVLEWATRGNKIRLELLHRTVGETVEARAVILAAF
jgi:hypothetical protein